MTLFGRSIINWRRVRGLVKAGLVGSIIASGFVEELRGEDPLRTIQTRAIESNQSSIAHWGWQPATYTQWYSHSNRLIPIYTFGTRGQGEGVDLDSYLGEHSVYRNAKAITDLYGQLPRNTLNPTADYCDQTDLYRLQQAAIAAGKKHVFLIVFDGMDWQTTQAAAIAKLGRIPYQEGRGTGFSFQDYDACGTTQFGYMVTSPHNEGTKVDVNAQTVLNPGGVYQGGYDPAVAGIFPWSVPTEAAYLATKSEIGNLPHAFTDSSSSATSMTAGIKTFNGGLNVDPVGKPIETLPIRLQREGWRVGIVTSVPFSHATPAAVYGSNVNRDDYQDLSRDMLGLPSISRPAPLPGLDVVLGSGWGVNKDATVEEVEYQGTNFVAGNRYLTTADLQRIDVLNGGQYVVAQRTPGRSGDELLALQAQIAAANRQRLFGFFGTAKAHLPFRTADGDFQPSPGREKTSEAYTPADINENPSLAEMTSAALTVLDAYDQPFWMMVEAGDVDWANHDNNLDNSAGAVVSGDDAVQVVFEWVETHSNWNESLVIVTADHGHMLFLDDPQGLAQSLQPTPAVVQQPTTPQ